jgi:Family of unknown function (DUF6529)
MAYHPYFAPDPARAAVAPEPEPPRPLAVKLLVPALIGAAVAVGLGVYGKDHKAGGQITFDLGFSGIFPMKIWLALAAGALALLQLLSALWMYGKLPGRAPGWIGGAHRVLGTAAFMLTLPVAYACLYALGFDDASPRVLAHSILGCAFYGAFVTKLLVLRTKRLPGWALPVVGGLLFTALVGVVLTSAVYTVAKSGSPGF